MNRTGNKKWIWIAAAVLVLAAGSVAVWKLLAVKDARAFYLEAEAKNFNRTSQWISKLYNDYQQKEKPYQTDAYKRRAEYTVDITSGGRPFGLENADLLFDLIHRSKLVIDSKRQPKDGTSVSKVTWLIAKAPFLGAEIFTTTDKLYFSVPVILPRDVFSLDKAGLEQVYDKFSIPVRPKRLVTGSDIAKTLKFDQTAFSEAMKGLGELVSAVFTEGTVQFGQSGEVTLSGKQVMGREVKVNLDEGTTISLYDHLSNAILSDDTLITLSYGNFADLSMLLDEAGLFRLSDFLDKAGVVNLNEKEKKTAGMLNVKKDNEGFRQQMKAFLQIYQPDSGLDMTVLIDRDGHILDRKLTQSFIGPAGRVTLEVQSGSSNAELDDPRNRYIKITSVNQPENGDGKTTELYFSPQFTNADGQDYTGTIDAIYRVSDAGGTLTDISALLDLTSKLDPSTLKTDHTIHFEATLDGEGGDGTLNGDWDTVTWSNKKLNSRNNTTKITLNADLPTFGIKGLKATASVAGEDRLEIGAFDLPDTGDAVVTDLNRATDLQLDKIGMKVLASFGTFYLTNKSVFDALLGK